MVRLEWPLAAITRVGLVTGRPGPGRVKRMPGMTVVNMVQSLTLPPVRVIKSGRPRVCGGLRQRADGRARCRSPRHLAVEFVDRLGDDADPRHEGGEGAGARPASEPVVDRLPRPVPFGQVTPGASGPGLEQHPVDHPAVVHPRTALHARSRRQRLDRLPLLVGQLVPAHHDPRPKQISCGCFEARPWSLGATATATEVPVPPAWRRAGGPARRRNRPGPRGRML